MEDVFYAWYQNICGQRHAESTIHELSNKELDNVKKVLSSINVGEFTDLVGQPPPADFDFENYEDCSADPPRAPEPEPAEAVHESEEDDAVKQGPPETPAGDNVVFFPVIPLTVPATGPPPTSSVPTRTRSRSPSTTTQGTSVMPLTMEQKVDDVVAKVGEEASTDRPDEGMATGAEATREMEIGNDERAQVGVGPDLGETAPRVTTTDNPTTTPTPVVSVEQDESALRQPTQPALNPPTRRRTSTWGPTTRE